MTQDLNFMQAWQTLSQNVTNKTKQMAYGGSGNSTDYNSYRLQRSAPYTKAGYIQPSIPQFKGLYTYTPAPGAYTNPHLVPTTFRQTMTYTRNRWPVSPGPQVTTGS